MNSFELKRLLFTLLGIAMFLTAQAQLSFTSPTTLFVMHSSGNHLMMATDYGGQLEAANAANAQQMTIVPDGNGYYYIRAKGQRYLSKVNTWYIRRKGFTASTYRAINTKEVADVLVSTGNNCVSLA